jgi:hypothetical protein
MIAAVLETTKIGKVAVYSVIVGVGISLVFAIGVSGAAGMLDALRNHRTRASIAWGTLTAACVLGTVAAVVFGLVVMSQKG